MPELQENEIVSKNIEIEYHLPKFVHRILANLIDIIIFVFLGFLLFWASRAIVVNTEAYQTANKKYQQSMLDSGLYFKQESGLISDIVTHLNNDGSYTNKGKCQQSEKSIKQFLTYMPPTCTAEQYKIIYDDYRSFFLNKDLYPKDSSLKQPYFVTDSNNNIIRNPVYDEYPNIDYNYYKDCYEVYFDTHALKAYQTYCSDYFTNINLVNNMLLFIAVPSAILISGLLTWFVPPLFFRRGRKTLGKALYHIGLVDRTYLCVSWKRWLARFAIFYFGELVLSIFTFGIPYIVSISMMAFSKLKQGFPDYMLGLYEVDTSNNKIYFNKEEILLDMAKTNKKPVNFRMEDIEP